MSTRLWLGFMSAICLAALFVSLFIGSTWISISNVFAGLTGQASDPINNIIQSIRLPRAMVAALVGAGLGASGAALQGFTRNPLAAPGLLGFSACAALGAVSYTHLTLPTICRV